MSSMTQAQGEALIAAREREKRIAADREHRDRRERIATAALQGLLAAPYAGNEYEYLSRQAVEAADALIAELNKPKEGGT